MANISANITVGTYGDGGTDFPVSFYNLEGLVSGSMSSVLVSMSSTDRNFLLIEKKEKLNEHRHHNDSICCICSSSPTLGSQ